MPQLQVKSKTLLAKYNELDAAWAHCTACEFGVWANKKCHCRGMLPADLLFVGEGPGKTEDALGFPFVGLAGTRVLQRWIERLREARPGLRWAAINLLACRPCEFLGGPNVAPPGEAVENCREHFLALLRMAKPVAVVLLGKNPQTAWATYFRELPAMKVLDLYHPSFVLRNGGEKSTVFEQELDKLVAFASRQIKRR